jgi:hypothetical protein
MSPTTLGDDLSVYALAYLGTSKMPGRRGVPSYRWSRPTPSRKRLRREWSDGVAVDTTATVSADG